MIQQSERALLVEPRKDEKLPKDAIPKVIKWKGTNMVRTHSFLAAVKEIIAWSENSDVTKVGIIGKPDSGKSTLAEAIAHTVHTYSELPFAIRVFKKQHMLNFEETLSTLTPSNYILVFDDISFLGADANKKQVDMIKQAETTIRHLKGGRDVKIILIYNYHYTLGLDKYLRQADYYLFTTIGTEEKDNVMSIVGKKYDKLIETFKRAVVSAKSRKYWLMKIGPKDPIIYRYRNPFIPVLFWNNESLRFIVSPKRQWINKFCGICDIGIESSDQRVGIESVEQLAKRGEINYGETNFKAAIKLLLYVNGYTMYGKHVVGAVKYINKAMKMNANNTLQNFAAYYGMKITNVDLRLKPDDPLYKVKPPE